MRFATYVDNGQVRAGVVAGEEIHPLPTSNTVLDLVRDGLPALLRAGTEAGSARPVALANVRLLPPLNPPAVRDFMAFEEHLEGVRRGMGGGDGALPAEWYTAPTFYFTNPHSLIGAQDDVAAPPGCELLDFELEVAAVVGPVGQDLTPAEAHDAIVGYTIFNDWSARDLQRREMQVGIGPAKGKDFASTLGPWLVTADEFDDRHDAEGFLSLELCVEINGVRVGRDVLSNMAWPFAELVAYASRGAALAPGDAFGSGTCGNGGCLAELWGRNGRREPAPLRPGDVVTMSVEDIGAIRNTVVAAAGPSVAPVPRARPRPRQLAEQARAGRR